MSVQLHAVWSPLGLGFRMRSIAPCQSDFNKHLWIQYRTIKKLSMILYMTRRIYSWIEIFVLNLILCMERNNFKFEKTCAFLVKVVNRSIHTRYENSQNANFYFKLDHTLYSIYYGTVLTFLSGRWGWWMFQISASQSSWWHQTHAVSQLHHWSHDRHMIPVY